MNNKGLYNKKEISRILEKATQIQTQKELYGDQDGLSEEELIQLANEVGIDRDSLLEAIRTVDEPSFDHSFSWLKGTSRIQDVTHIGKEFTDEEWDAIVQEIRRVTGGIGKISKVGKSYEWEQRRRDIGYKHFSFTPENGKTRLQMVSSWGGLRRLSHIVGFMVPFAATAIMLDGSPLSEFPAIAVAAFSGIVIGLPLVRLYLKSYYNRQMKLLKDLTTAVSKKISRSGTSGSIEIEDTEVYNHDTASSPDRERTT